MPLRDDLLNPIAGASPAGADLRYDPLYDKIKEARREEELIPSGGYDRPRPWSPPRLVNAAHEPLEARHRPKLDREIRRVTVIPHAPLMGQPRGREN